MYMYAIYFSLICRWFTIKKRVITLLRSRLANTDIPSDTERSLQSVMTLGLKRKARRERHRPLRFPLRALMIQCIRTPHRIIVTINLRAHLHVEQKIAKQQSDHRQQLRKQSQMKTKTTTAMTMQHRRIHVIPARKLQSKNRKGNSILSDVFFYRSHGVSNESNLSGDKR